MSQNLPTILKAARQLPPEQRRELAEELLKETAITEHATSLEPRKRQALAIVEETFGSIKGLDRNTLIQMAEDEQFCGY